MKPLEPVRGKGDPQSTAEILACLEVLESGTYRDDPEQEHGLFDAILLTFLNREARGYANDQDLAIRILAFADSASHNWWWS